MFNETPVLTMFSDENHHEILEAIACAVMATFPPTQPEYRQSDLKQRTARAEKVVKILRGDFKKGVVYIKDHLERFLRAEMNGQDWKPDVRRVWITDDGAY